MARERRVGIDVRSKERIVAVKDGKKQTTLRFSNDADGHSKLCRYLTKRGRFARVCIEATGIDSFNAAMAMHNHPRIAVMVANPRATASFAQAMMKRAKTDDVDAHTMLVFLQRMPFVEWQPPSEAVLGLRAVARQHQLKTVVQQKAKERNRLHAARRNGAIPAFLIEEFEESIRMLEEREAWLEQKALAFIAEHTELDEKFKLLSSVTGIGDRSGIDLLGELLMLPEDMDVRQWVAFAGLDPRPYRSGTSVHKKPRISKVGNAIIRHALFMPALSAIQHNKAVQAFFQRLVGRGKLKMQAVVAVMRKRLHAIYGMFNNNEPFQADKCFPRQKVPQNP